jgi:hypothetical protein
VESSIQISTPASAHTQKGIWTKRAWGSRFLQNDEKTLLSNSSIKTLSLMLENLIPIDRKKVFLLIEITAKLGKYSLQVLTQI